VLDNHKIHTHAITTKNNISVQNSTNKSVIYVIEFHKIEQTVKKWKQMIGNLH
jgi:hypothetical protein